MVGLAMNLLASALLGPEDRAQCSLYLGVAAFFIAAVAFFGVSWELENARNQWIEEGTPRATMKEPIQFRAKTLWAFFCIAIVFLGLGIFFLGW